MQKEGGGVGISLGKLHFNQTHDLPVDINIRSLTPISREACLRTGIVIDDLRSRPYEYFRSLPLLQNQDEETIREAMRAYEHIRVCNVAVVQDQHDEILRSQQIAKQHRPRSPKLSRTSSHSPNRGQPVTQPLGKNGLNDALHRERAIIDQNELKQRQKIHEELIRAGELARKQDMRKTVVSRLYTDEVAATQDIMARVRSEGGPSLISAVTLRGGERRTPAPPTANDPRYRYTRYAQHGAFAGAVEAHAAQARAEQEEAQRGRTRQRPLAREAAASPASTGQVWARLTDGHSRERDVDTELSLATFRLTMREREEHERRRVRAEEYEMKVRAMKEKEAQEQRAKEERLMGKYDRLGWRESERRRAHAEENNVYRSRLEQRLHAASTRTQELDKQREGWRRSTLTRRKEKEHMAETLRRDREMEKASRHAESQLSHSARADTRAMLETIEGEGQRSKEEEVQERHARSEAVLQRQREERERELSTQRAKRQERQQHVSEVQMTHEEARWQREEALRAQMAAHEERMRAAEEARQQQVAQRQTRTLLATELRKQKEEQQERALQYRQECVLRETETDKRTKQQIAQEQRLIERERERLWRASQRRLHELREAAARVMSSANVRVIDQNTLGEPEDMDSDSLVRAAGLPSTKTVRLSSGSDHNPSGTTYASAHDSSFASSAAANKLPPPPVEVREHAAESTTPVPPPIRASPAAQSTMSREQQFRGGRMASQRVARDARDGSWSTVFDGTRMAKDYSVRPSMANEHLLRDLY